MLRSAYFPKRVHRTLFSKTLDLQPLCGLRKGAEEGATPQFAAADSSPYILRTEIAFQAIPVLRMAYFTKRPYYGLFVKTHMLQPQAACEGGAEGGDNLSVWEL